MLTYEQRTTRATIVPATGNLFQKYVIHTQNIAERDDSCQGLIPFGDVTLEIANLRRTTLRLRAIAILQ
jgi:hypothetical protein